MANRFKRKEILQTICNRIGTICSNVYPNTRPSATDRMDSFVVVRLPLGVRPASDIHNYSTIQLQCYVRDKKSGVENVSAEEELIDNVLEVMHFSDSLMNCCHTPVILDSKSDGMGFHSTIIQINATIKI